MMQGHQELAEFKQWAHTLWSEYQEEQHPLVKPFRAQMEEGLTWYGDALGYHAALFPKSEFPDFQSFRLYLQYLEPVLEEFVAGDPVDWQYLKTMRKSKPWPEILEAFAPELISKQRTLEVFKQRCWSLDPEMEWSLELDIIQATAFEPMDTFRIVADTEQGYLWLLSEGHVTVGSRSRYGKYVEVVEGPDEGLSREFHSIARLGRAQGLEVRLQDSELSEHHATLEVWDGRMFLTDTLASTELANEECFKIGRSTLRVSWKQI